MIWAEFYYEDTNFRSYFLRKSDFRNDFVFGNVCATESRKYSVPLRVDFHWDTRIFLLKQEKPDFILSESLYKWFSVYVKTNFDYETSVTLPRQEKHTLTWIRLFVEMIWFLWRRIFIVTHVISFVREEKPILRTIWPFGKFVKLSFGNFPFLWA